MKTGLLGKFCLTIFVASFVLFFLAGCGEEEKRVEAKSMDEIRKEEGVPVIVEEIELKPFESYITLYADLQGIRQSTKSSLVGDKILKINAGIGEFVKKGDIIVEFPTDNPAIQYEQAKAAYENAKKNFERMKGLLEAGDISQAQYDGAETQYIVNKRNFFSVKQMVEVESPIDGIITEMIFNEGDACGVGKPLFTVAQLSSVVATVWATEDEVRDIKRGMPAKITTSEKSYQGRVREVGIAMDLKRRAFKVEILIPNPDRTLKPGVTTQIDIKVYENPEAVVIPENLIQRRNGNRYVFLEENGKAVERPVVQGKRYGVNTEIIEGLEKGDRLIAEGTSLLEKGRKVKIVNKGK